MNTCFVELFLNILSIIITNFWNNISWNGVSNSKFRRQLFHKSSTFIKMSNHSWSLNSNSFSTFSDPNKIVIIISNFSDLSLSHSLKTFLSITSKYLSTQSGLNWSNNIHKILSSHKKRGFFTLIWIVFQLQTISEANSKSFIY